LFGICSESRMIDGRYIAAMCLPHKKTKLRNFGGSV